MYKTTPPLARVFPEYWARSLAQAARTGRPGSIARMDAIHAVIDKMASAGLIAPRLLELDAR